MAQQTPAGDTVTNERADTRWLFAFVLIVGTLLLLSVYRPITRMRLFTDDFIFIYEASRLSTPAQIFNPHYSSRGRLPRPFTLLYFWLGWHLWGLNPLAWHVSGFLLHLCAAALLALWTSRLTRNRLAGAVSAAAFLLYAQHGEVLSWPASVGKILSAILMLGCLLTFRHWRQHENKSAGIASLVLLTAALLTEESAIILPALLFLADILTLSSARSISAALRSQLPFVAITATVFAASLALTTAHRGNLGFARGADWIVNESAGTISTFVGSSTVVRLCDALGACGLSAFESVQGALLALGLYAAACIALSRRAPAAAFHGLWIPLTWLPYACFVPHSYLVERYTYIPCLGLAALIGCAWPTRMPRALVALILLLVLTWNASCLGVRFRQAAVVQSLPQTEAETIRTALQKLGPRGHAYVFLPPLWAHFTSSAVGLYGNLPPQRLHDWYDALRQGTLQDGDRMIFWDLRSGIYRDLTDAVRPFLRRPTAHDRVDGVVREWSGDALQSWQPVALSPAPPGWDTPGIPGALVLSNLQTSPTDFYALRVTLQFTRPPTDATPEIALGWATDESQGYGPQRFVASPLQVSHSDQTVELYPSTVTSWWTEGHIRQLYLIPCTLRARVRIESVEMLEFPARHDLSPR